MTALEEYLRSTEPGRREKAYAWKTAIGLQQVDGLTPSDYLIKTACRNIEGEITLEESRNFLERYLTPALNAGFVERTEPGSAPSPDSSLSADRKGDAAMSERFFARNKPFINPKTARFKLAVEINYGVYDAVTYKVADGELVEWKREMTKI